MAISRWQVVDAGLRARCGRRHHLSKRMLRADFLTRISKALDFEVIRKSDLVDAGSIARGDPVDGYVSIRCLNG